MLLWVFQNTTSELLTQVLPSSNDQRNKLNEIKNYSTKSHRGLKSVLILRQLIAPEIICFVPYLGKSGARILLYWRLSEPTHGLIKKIFILNLLKMLFFLSTTLSYPNKNWYNVQNFHLWFIKRTILSDRYIVKELRTREKTKLPNAKYIHLKHKVT